MEIKVILDEIEADDWGTTLATIIKNAIVDEARAAIRRELRSNSLLTKVVKESSDVIARKIREGIDKACSK